MEICERVKIILKKDPHTTSCRDNQSQNISLNSDFEKKHEKMYDKSHIKRKSMMKSESS